MIYLYFVWDLPLVLCSPRPLRSVTHIYAGESGHHWLGAGALVNAMMACCQLDHWTQAPMMKYVIKCVEDVVCKKSAILFWPYCVSYGSMRPPWEDLRPYAFCADTISDCSAWLIGSVWPVDLQLYDKEATGFANSPEIKLLSFIIIFPVDFGGSCPYTDHAHAH